MCVHEIVFRERERAEQKDMKVLEILNLRDEKIEDLQKTLSYANKELNQAQNRYISYSRKNIYPLLMLFYVNVDLLRFIFIMHTEKQSYKRN